MREEISLHDIYARFARIWADGVPIVDVSVLGAAIHAQGLELRQVSNDWLRGLDADWVHGETSQPFHDEVLNRRYRQILRLGL
jgi:hypothetical protein